MELTQRCLTRTWHLLLSSACARPPAPGTGASRWCATHILRVAVAGRGPAGDRALPWWCLVSHTCLCLGGWPCWQGASSVVGLRVVLGAWGLDGWRPGDLLV